MRQRKIQEIERNGYNIKAVAEQQTSVAKWVASVIVTNPEGVTLPLRNLNDLSFNTPEEAINTAINSINTGEI